MTLLFETLASIALADALWLAAKAALVVGVAGLAVTLLPRLAASYRYSILFYAIVATLLMPVLAATLPSWPVVPDWLGSARPLPAAARHVEQAPPAAAQSAPPVDARATSATGIARDGLRAAPAGTSLPALTVLAWLAGITVLLVRTVVAMRRLRGLRTQAVALDDPDWQRLLSACSRQLALPRSPALRFHPEPIMPMTVGLRQPAILLPIEAQDWPDPRRRDVLLHELAHIKRGDLAGEWLSLVACTLQWFNPLMWWAQRRMIVERERACDDLVLRAGADPTRYADCLLKTAAQFRATPAPAPGMARASDLETRLLAVLDAKRRRGSSSRRPDWTIGALAALIALPVASLALAEDPRAELPATTAAQDDDVRRLADAVRATEPETRLAARRELDALGPRHPVVVTLDAQRFARYRSDTELFRDASTVDMAATGEAALQTLLATLNAASAVDRAAAAQALGKFSDPRAVQGLIGALGDPNWHVREWSARALGDIADAYAVPALMAAMSDRHEAVREWAARALGDIADPAAADGLVQGLADPSGEVREWAARSLGRIGSPVAVDALIARLHDTDADVREWALRALGDIGDPRAMDAVAALIEDDDANVREWALRSLAAMAKTQGERR